MQSTVLVDTGFLIALFDNLAAITAVIERFAEHDIDLADATLVWLAGVEGTRQVLTTDRRDFDMLRTADGKAFERLWVSP